MENETVSITEEQKKEFLFNKHWVELVGGDYLPPFKTEYTTYCTNAAYLEANKSEPTSLPKSDKIKPIVEFVEDERKVIGWKFKEGFEKYERTCCEIINTVNNDTTHYSFTGYGGVDINKGILFKIGSGCEEDLREAGVLDIWFEPVFEEVKKMVNEDKICRSMLELEFAYKYKGSIYDSVNEMTFNDKREMTFNDKKIHFLLGKIAELQLKMEEANGK